MSTNQGGQIYNFSRTFRKSYFHGRWSYSSGAQPRASSGFKSEFSWNFNIAFVSGVRITTSKFWIFWILLSIPIPHSFWPQEAPKSAFFRARTPKYCQLKLPKISNFHQFSKYHRFGLRNRMEMTYPPKWRHWVEIIAEKHLICNADIRHIQICKLRVVVEKVGNFVRCTKMARGARSGARNPETLLADG